MEVTPSSMQFKAQFRRLQGLHQYGVALRRCLGLAAMSLGLLFLLPAYAIHQEPANSAQLVKLFENNSHISIDARQQWQAAIIGGQQLPVGTASSPDAWWALPDALFKTSSKPERMVLTGGQRYVARLNIMSTGFGSHINLTFKMPRLDAVHMAYRYDQQPWERASAGDRIAMNKWVFSDRQPSFDIPLRPGNLHVVVEIAHTGFVDTPMLLQSASLYRDDRLLMGLGTGLSVGINLVLAIVGIAAAVSFRRWSFLSITLMTTLVACLVAVNSGIAGVYLFTHSASFNDEAKFAVPTLWCVLFPWITSIALSLRTHSRPWWWVSVVYAALGTVFTFWAMDYAIRGMTYRWVLYLALGSVVLALLILGQALLRKQSNALYLAPGIVLYALAIFAPLVSFLGFLLNDDASLLASVATMVAAMVLLSALVRQHRQGRMVMARAKTSIGRDVLTGLLNRQGYMHHLGKNVERMLAERTYGAFFYIRVSDANNLVERYGDEGFDIGMVQIAAALSSSVTVVDTLGRVAPNAFALTVLMPRDAKLANALAQKILTRTMALASHGAPMAQTARIAVAWLPVFGTLLPDIERRCLRVLRQMEEGKRIAWVGGAYAHADASQLPDGLSHPTTKPNNGQTADDDLPSLPGMINRLEMEMLGPDTEQIRTESEHLLARMKEREGQDTLIEPRKT